MKQNFMLDFSKEEFVSPKKENNVIYTWIWNEPVSVELIETQLEEFAKAGIGGIYILPMPENFRPNTMKTSMTPEYLSIEFFECVKYALKKGKDLGMELWLYDEGGWPSGGACGRTYSENPRAVETVLCKREITLNADEKYCISKDAVSAFLGKKRVFDGYKADADLVITEYYTEKASVKSGISPNRIDSTNKDVVDTFINNTYECYKNSLGEFFNDISAIFTDEPSVIQNLIPENFFGVFKEKYGYAAEDFLYCIDDENLAATKEEMLARIHYGRLLGDLFYENYCKNIGDWCRKHGKKFAGHLDIDHLPEGAAKQCYFSHLRSLREFDIPGVDVIWHQIQKPDGKDVPVPEGAPFFPRLASSAARQSGNRLSLTESLAVYGDGITPDEFRYVLNYQAVRGINVFNIMLTSSGTSTRSLLVERPVFSCKKPGFYNLCHLNTYYKRLSYLLILGESQTDTALYIPCADFWANGEFSERASGNYISEGVNLEKQNIEFDIIDDYAVMDSEIALDGLKIGNVTYKNIIVPECAFMPDEVKEKIAPFVKIPEKAKNNTEIRTMKRKLPSGTLYFLFNESEKLCETSLSEYGDNLYRLNLTDGEITKADFEKIKIESGDICVIYSTSDIPEFLSDEEEYSVSPGNFEIVKIKKFDISKNGIKMTEVPCDTEITNEFSGEITYKATYELPETPSTGERYRIRLTDTSSSASISIDKTKVATVGITPMEATVPGHMLQRTGIIEITVANTAANEIVAKNDVLKSHPSDVFDVYHDKCIDFEKKAPKIKFGGAELVKMKDVL